jgi:uncharacterized hydrophobic protein (TIGR00341 family)
MAVRLIQVFLPAEAAESARRTVHGDTFTALGYWETPLADDQVLVRVLVDAKDTGVALDLLDRHFAALPGFRAVLLPVDATLPRIEEKPRDEAEAGAARVPRIGRVSREELYAAVTDGLEVSAVYLAMIVFSTTVATVGLHRDNVAIVIGAMVMAPLLGPNVALSLATTLGDLPLARRSIVVGAAGLVVALGLSAALGSLFPPELTLREIAVRTRVDLGDVVLGLASGSAAALSFTSGVPAVLVGVMVAVALLPPTVVLGMLLGAGDRTGAAGAALVLVTNIICVNLAGVATFLVLGVQPSGWWEARQARRAARIVLAAWLLLLASLVGALVALR